MGGDPWIVAFAPIRIISSGGFLAVSYLKNRDSTGDIDYLIDPEFAGDREVQAALRTAIHAVADRFEFTNKWINEDMAIFVTKEARRTLFAQAERQGITLFRGEHLEILAAPLEWALERKLRRIHAADRDRKAEYDMADAVALLRHLKERNQRPLDAEWIRTMNTNGFDILPNDETMRRVAREYRRKYHEDVFR